MKRRYRVTTSAIIEIDTSEPMHGKLGRLKKDLAKFYTDVALAGFGWCATRTIESIIGRDVMPEDIDESMEGAETTTASGNKVSVSMLGCVAESCTHVGSGDE